MVLLNSFHDVGVEKLLEAWEQIVVGKLNTWPFTIKAQIYVAIDMATKKLNCPKRISVRLHSVNMTRG